MQRHVTRPLVSQTLRKDNTGYDLKQLFIGSEGTLGVITGVSILCPPAPNSVQVRTHLALGSCPLLRQELLRPSTPQVMFLAVPSFGAVQRVLSRARTRLGEVLSACEFLDAASLEVVTQHVSGASRPLGDSRHPFYMVGAPRAFAPTLPNRRGGAGSRTGASITSMY